MEKIDSSFLGRGQEEERRGSEPLLSVPEVHGRLPDRTLYGYPAKQYHPDDPDGDEGGGPGKQCHLALRLL